MNENKQIQNNNDEIEIDLRELWQELKKNFLLIAGVTATFVVAAAVYSFVIAKPVYSCSAMIRVPINASVTQVKTCIEVLKTNIGKNSLSQISLVNGTYVLLLNFKNNDKDVLVTDRDNFMKLSQEKINKILYEADKRRISYEVIMIVDDYIEEISKNVKESVVTTEEVNKKLEFLLDKIENKEKNHVYPAAEIIEDSYVESILVFPNKKKNIILSMLVGLFISCGFIVTRYIFKKEV